MTGFTSKKAAALDEEGFYTAYPKEEDDDTQVYQRPWVGLTEQERNDIEDYCEMMIGKPAFDAIEAKLKEKNT